MLRAVGGALRASVLTMLLASSMAAQEGYRFVTLKVSDEGTQVALPDVRITVKGMGDRDWSTDARGEALIAVAPGRRVTVELRRMGYAPRTIEVEPGANAVTLSVQLQASALMLDTTRVMGEAASQMFAGFDQRRLRGAGSATFITRDQIEKQMSIRTIDVVRRAVGTRVIDSSGVLLVASSRGAKAIIGGGAAASKKGPFDLAPCVMRVAVDGMLREWGFSLDAIDPSEIHGVEIYPGPATMPVEFSGLRKDAYCGLVMIWTRRGR